MLNAESSAGNGERDQRHSSVFYSAFSNQHSAFFLSDCRETPQNLPAFSSLRYLSLIIERSTS